MEHSAKTFECEALGNKEMEEGTPIAEHLEEMKEITDRLALIGAPIFEEDQVVPLLGSVPLNYSTIAW